MLEPSGRFVSPYPLPPWGLPFNLAKTIVNTFVLVLNPRFPTARERSLILFEIAPRQNVQDFGVLSLGRQSADLAGNAILGFPIFANLSFLVRLLANFEPSKVYFNKI